MHYNELPPDEQARFARMWQAERHEWALLRLDGFMSIMNVRVQTVLLIDEDDELAQSVVDEMARNGATIFDSFEELIHARRELCFQDQQQAIQRMWQEELND